MSQQKVKRRNCCQTWCCKIFCRRPCLDRCAFRPPSPPTYEFWRNPETHEFEIRLTDEARFGLGMASFLLVFRKKWAIFPSPPLPPPHTSFNIYV